MEDPAKIEGSVSENMTEIKGNAMGGSPKGDSVAGFIHAGLNRVIGLAVKGDLCDNRFQA